MRHVLRLLPLLRGILIWPTWLTFYVTARLLRYVHPEWEPRRWSNAELERFAHMFGGDVINVSAWQDSDKQGRRYADYFRHKSSYRITNCGGERGRSQRDDEILLDLEGELPAELRLNFDVVFNHTTLEHVYDVRKAVANLCGLSRDVVIVVVPFVQFLHWEQDAFSDYWRISPFALEQMFQENGLSMVYFSYNENPVYPIYMFAVAARKPDVWQKRFPESPKLAHQVTYVGQTLHSHWHAA